MNENPLHREIIEEHATNPLGNSKLETFSHQGFWKSEKTGNTCVVQILVEKSELCKIGYHLQGSVLALASASIMVEQVRGKKIIEAKAVVSQLMLFFDAHSVRLPDELSVYETIRRFPDRHDCALLAWRGFSIAVADLDQ